VINLISKALIAQLFTNHTLNCPRSLILLQLNKSKGVEADDEPPPMPPPL